MTSMQRDWESFGEVRSCEACPLARSRTYAVPAEAGPRYSKGGLAFMGVAASFQDDEKGKPLTATVNRGKPNTGALFDRLLKAAGIERDTLLLMLRVRCHPPRNRVVDYPEALANCDPHTRAELAAYDPAVVVVMGAQAIQPIFGALAKVGESAGKVRTTGPDFGWGSRTWVATYNPTALFGSADLAPKIEADFRLGLAIHHGRSIYLSSDEDVLPY